MRFDWIKTRQTQYGLYMASYSAVVIAILVVINLLAKDNNKSFDATSNKRFSLSDQTLKVVKNLKQDVNVTLFDQSGRLNQGKDLLDRYDNLSTKLNVSYVDPDKKPQLAKTAGIRSYGTIVVEAAGRRQEAKSLTEEEVTGAIIRALKGGERNVCFVTGSGEHSLDDSGRTGYSSAKDVLERNNYKTRTVSLLEKPEVPKDCTILLIGGPRFDYVQPVVDAVKKYADGGGRVLVMLDPPMRLGKEEVTENQPLSKLIEMWGVTLNKDLVLDTSGIGQIFGLGPEVPLVTSYESHTIVREMKEVATAFPLSRSVETKPVDKVTNDKLFSTSANSYATANLSSAEIRLNPAKDKKGPFSLAAAGTIAGQGRFVVVGSSGWVSNNIIRFNGNRDLFVNMMNWLSSDEDLISIRPKEPEDRRLSLTRAQMWMIRSISQFMLPLAVVVFGVVVWWRRR